MDIGMLLLVVVPLFVIVDPLASTGLFLGLTPGAPLRARLRMAGKASVFALVVLALFALAGRAVLQYLGIQIFALQAAGGVLLVMIGLRMLREGEEIPHEEVALPTGGSHAPGRGAGDPSLVPLGIPMLAGPGAISLVIVQSTSFGATTVIVATLGVMAASFAILAAAARAHRLLGDDGARVITRVMGILTVAFAMQYVFDGVGAWLDTHGGVP